MTAPLMLEVSNLKKSFGSVIVANGFDLEVRTGEALGILGPNGAGKTTFFNMIAGIAPPDSGQIKLGRRDITKTTPHERAHAGIGRSFQIPQPFENLTVYENLLVGAVYGQGVRERDAVQMCGEILENTQMAKRANALAGSLSLLERKRLELARALATKPKLLLLDEIAGGLTEGECHALIATVKQVHASGTTIVWIEHVVHALMAVVTRLIVLNGGHKIADGLPSEVIAQQDVRQIYLGITV